MHLRSQEKNSESSQVPSTSRKSHLYEEIDSCPYCQRGSEYFSCLHKGCTFHYHTLRMMQRHEKEAHHCPADCEACAALKSGNVEMFRENLRPKYNPTTHEIIPSSTSTSTPTSTTNGTDGTVTAVHVAPCKQAETPSVESATSRSGTPSLMNNYLSSILYSKLVEQQDKISNRMLVPLPRSPTVHEFLEQYANHVNKETLQTWGIAPNQIGEVVHGFEIMFNIALGRTLLYQPERIQLAYQLEQRTQRRVSLDPSMFYGVDHFSRMLAWIPDFMNGFPDFNPNDRELIIKISANMLAFITAHIHEYCTTAYIRAETITSKSRR